MYKCLHQAAPTYLAELCSPVSESASRGHLCSATQCDLAIPRFRTTTYGQRCFAVSGPTLWNLLPLSVHDPSRTVTQFCARLKTVLFCRACEMLAWHLRDSLGCKDCCANIFSLTYLLTICITVFLWIIILSICVIADDCQCVVQIVRYSGRTQKELVEQVRENRPAPTPFERCVKPHCWWYTLLQWYCCTFLTGKIFGC